MTVPKAICNHCGRLHEVGTRCNCKQTQRIDRERWKEYARNNDGFYNSKAWRSVSRYVRQRDCNLDRLAMYLSWMRHNSPQDASGWPALYNTLADYLLTATDDARHFGGVVVVHHIIPREDDKSRWYDLENLITLNSTTHEFIHQLYADGHKQEVQRLLFEAVKADL